MHLVSIKLYLTCKNNFIKKPGMLIFDIESSDSKYAEVWQYKSCAHLLMKQTYVGKLQFILIRKSI